MESFPLITSTEYMKQTVSLFYIYISCLFLIHIVIIGFSFLNVDMDFLATVNALKKYHSTFGRSEKHLPEQ